MSQVREYPYAYALKVQDGDSVIIKVDVGFRAFLTVKTRLLGLDAPELRGETLQAGRAAREYLHSLLHDVNGPLRLKLRTYKDPEDKYGRWLVRIVACTVAGEVDVNQSLLDSGHAVERNY